MKRFFVFLSLFGSLSTLFCCALPVLLVSLGMGGVFVSLTSNFPQIQFINDYKLFVFIVTAFLLASTWFLTRPKRITECPIDENQRDVCKTVKPWTRIILYISITFYVLGLLFCLCVAYFLCMSSHPPLAVDLDGTLVNTDVFFESAIWYIRKNPLHFFQMCWWLFTQGREGLKSQIESRVALPVSDLPFNSSIVEWLKNEKEKGRTLVLVTGASQKYAEQVAEHLNLFSSVFGVCKERPRLTGRNKRRFLVHLYGENNFDYIGNSIIDLAVWKQTRKCIIANAFSPVVRIAQKKFQKTQVLSEPFFKKQYWKAFQSFFYVLALRIGTFLIFATVFLRDSQNFLNSLFVLPALFLFYTTAFLVAGLGDLGPHRKFQSRGVFYYINPYWGLASFPLGLLAFISAHLTQDVFELGVWWFIIYFVLEYLRWTFKKYYIYYDAVLTVLLFLCVF